LESDGGELDLGSGNGRVARVRAEASLFSVDEGHINHADEAE
jgi:hypothetical protein